MGKQTMLTRWEVELLKRALYEHSCKLHKDYKTLKNCAELGGNALITPDAAKQMSEQKLSDAADLRNLAIKLEGHDIYLEVQE